MTGKSNKDRFFNSLTVLMLLGTCWILIWFLTVYSDPQSILNPVPPKTASPIIVATVTQQPKKWPETPTQAAVASTATPHTPVPTPTATVTPELEITVPPDPADFAFAPLQDHPIAIQNIVHPDLGCGWMGVGGQVLDLEGAPAVGLLLRLTGNLAGQQIDRFSLAGSAADLGYGPAGYEIELGDEPIVSAGELFIQLLDTESRPLSDKISIETFADCSRNLIVISFKQQD